MPGSGAVLLDGNGVDEVDCLQRDLFGAPGSCSRLIPPFYGHATSLIAAHLDAGVILVVTV